MTHAAHLLANVVEVDWIDRLEDDAGEKSQTILEIVQPGLGCSAHRDIREHGLCGKYPGGRRPAEPEPENSPRERQCRTRSEHTLQEIQVRIYRPNQWKSIIERFDDIVGDAGHNPGTPVAQSKPLYRPRCKQSQPDSTCRIDRYTAWIKAGPYRKTRISALKTDARKSESQRSKDGTEAIAPHATKALSHE